MKSKIISFKGLNLSFKDIIVNKLKNKKDRSKWKKFQTKMKWPLKRMDKKKGDYWKYLRTITDLSFECKDYSEGYLEIRRLSIFMSIRKADLTRQIRNINTWGHVLLNLRKDKVIIEGDNNRIRCLNVRIILKGEPPIWLIDKNKEQLLSSLLAVKQEKEYEKFRIRISRSIKERTEKNLNDAVDYMIQKSIPTQDVFIKKHDITLTIISKSLSHSLKKHIDIEKVIEVEIYEILEYMKIIGETMGCMRILSKALGALGYALYYKKKVCV